ncbi:MULTISPECIES: hypothetical protein [Rhodococcus]|nr:MULTISPECIES: hypothetical protein [Rhodococcus]
MPTSWSRSPATGTAAVLLGADDYDALRETIAVLSDTDLLAAHLAGRLR